MNKIKKILIIGYKGMLGKEVYLYLKSKGFNIIGLSKKELDIRNIKDINNKINKYFPDLLINCAAYTNVKNAELIDKKKCFDINTFSVGNLAKITKKYNIGFITFSTDYVFDGKRKGYDECDNAHPLNNYGKSKLLGEKLAFKENNNSIIIRTSWLYGGKNNKLNNFFNFVRNSKKDLYVVNNQFGSPTNIFDLSKAIYKLIMNYKKYKGRILHLTNNGYTSWYDFSIYIKEKLKKRINIYAIQNDKGYIIRPKYSILNNNSDIKLIDWKFSLNNYLSKIKK